MATRDTRAFDTLFTKSVPHIFEKIFFSLDYKSFKSCLQVSKSWNDIMTTDRFHEFGNHSFREDIEQDLCQASISGSLSEVKSILSSFMVDVNCMQGKYHQTPLYHASSNCHIDVVQLLLNEGADPNKKNTSGETPLNWAATKGHKEVVQVLIDGGADPNWANEWGETPLHSAASEGHKDVVQLLLGRGADPNKATGYGSTPLHRAARSGHKDVVKLLLDRGADP